MNVITRGIRNALRSPVRSGAIVIMLAISIGLTLAMLTARSSVNAKVAEIKATTATGVTINPAGVSGGLGGGDDLTTAQMKTIASTAHITSAVSTLTDQLGSTDTNLTPSFSLGSIGNRQFRFETQTGETSNKESGSPATPRKMPTPRTNITGSSNPSATIPSSKLTSGSMIDGSTSDAIALVGKALADKNNLTIGSTFIAYGKTVTVKGIFSVDNAFQNNGIVMPIATLQTLTSQPDAISNITATVDSSDNVASAVASLKEALGSKADIISQQEEAANSVKPLESIVSLATSGVVGAAIAGAVIILLAMVMVVRERRHEIGVIKAIGGTNTKVITQFITEALTLTIIGGIIGLCFGVFVSGPITQSLVSSGDQPSPVMMSGNGPRLMQATKLQGFGKQLNANVQTITHTLTFQTFAISIGIMFLIAIVGSAVPAWAIARIRPAEVLRTS